MTRESARIESTRIESVRVESVTFAIVFATFAIILAIAAAIAPLAYAENETSNTANATTANAASVNATRTNAPTSTAVSPATSTRLIRELEGNITALEEEGFPVDQLHDLLNEMRLLHGLESYDTVALRAQETDAIIAGMRGAVADIDAAKRLLDYAVGRGKNASAAQSAYDAAKREYARGNLAQASSSIAACERLLAELLASDIEEMHGQATSLAAMIENDTLLAPLREGALERMDDAYAANDSTAFLEAASMLEETNRTIHEMIALREKMRALEGQNRSVTRIMDAIDELMLLHANGANAEFAARMEETMRLIDSIEDISALLEQTERDIAELAARGIDVGRAKEHSAIAREEFGFENYESAAEYGQKAAALVEEIRQDHILSSLVDQARTYKGYMYVKEHWIGFLLSIIVTAIVGRVVWEYGRHLLLTRRIAALKRETAARRTMLITLQEQYYKHHQIDKETYIAGFSEYQVRQDELQELIPRLEQRLVTLRGRGAMRVIERLRAMPKKGIAIGERESGAQKNLATEGKRGR
jgi:hypothetical protein